MSKTVVGLFNSTAAAQQAKQALISEGYETSDITIHSNDSDSAYSGTAGSGTTAASTTTGTATGVAAGIGEKIGGFFRSLTGGDEHEYNNYATGVQQGGAILSVTTDDHEAEDVADLLSAHGARLEGGYPAGTTDYASNAETVTGQTAIPIVQEDLVVGKRAVDRGGVRIYSHVVERPVEQDVTLREERVNVERRPVDRQATAADFQAGQGSIELHATGEEAVVGKTSRVVEEVRVGKETTERTDTVRDTVRKTEVEVEDLTADVTSKGRY